MEKLILVLSLDAFDVDKTKAALNTPDLTRQKISDTLYEVTFSNEPNELFATNMAQIFVLEEFVDALNQDEINIDNSWVLPLDVVGL